MSFLVKCRFLDKNNAPNGREYTYASNDDVAVGEIVVTSENKEVVVTAVDIPQEAAAGFRDKLKYVARINKLANTDSYNQEIIDAQSEEVEKPETEISLPDISVNKDNLAIVEQLPIISEQLKLFSVEIDNITAVVDSMECTEKNRQTVKKYRQKINSLLTEFEKRRIAIKNEILKPYDVFNNDYKTYVSEKISRSLEVLDSRIAVIENDIKQKLQDDTESYFYELTASKGIEWLTWEQSGIKVGLSDNKTALRREISEFIDKVCDAEALIETQEYKAEITVEYRKDLNLAKAIATVQARIKAVEQQERLRREQEERRKDQEEQRRLQAEALERARAEQKPAALEPPKQGPVTLATQKTQETIKSEPVPIKKYSIAFRINDETQERLGLVKKFLVDNGYEYSQVLLKNIIESQAV